MWRVIVLQLRTIDQLEDWLGKQLSLCENQNIEAFYTERAIEATGQVTPSPIAAVP